MVGGQVDLPQHQRHRLNRLANQNLSLAGTLPEGGGDPRHLQPQRPVCQNSRRRYEMSLGLAATTCPHSPDAPIGHPSPIAVGLSCSHWTDHLISLNIVQEFNIHLEASSREFTLKANLSKRWVRLCCTRHPHARLARSLERENSSRPWSVGARGTTNCGRLETICNRSRTTRYTALCAMQLCSVLIEICCGCLSLNVRLHLACKRFDVSSCQLRTMQLLKICYA
jgi:hypothetical protein